MFRFIGLCFGTLVRLLRARRNLLLENLALRQQLAVLKRRHPRPRLDLLDTLFWVTIRRFWSGWQQSLIAVTPETVVRWHKAGFIKRAPRDPEPAKRWLTFLRNHREAMAAMDFFTVPTFYCFLMCDWEGYTTGTIGPPNANQRRRENVRVPASLIYTGIPRGRSSGRDSWRSRVKGSPEWDSRRGREARYIQCA